MTPDPASGRRLSYGPRSPAVGERGAQTRQRIVECTHELLSERGYHDTTVDDIAMRAGISRAALYQYFPGKGAIFEELANECGGALFRLIGRLGPLGPTAVGFDNLHWWLGEWSWIYDKYATMFMQWSQVSVSDRDLRPMVGQFVADYSSRVADRLRQSGVEGIDRQGIARTLMLTVHRLNEFRHRLPDFGLEAAHVVDAAAVTLQLVLFPTTPPSVLYDSQILSANDPFLARRLPAGGEAPSVPGTAPLTDLGPRALKTAESILTAASQTIAARGSHAASIDDIVGAAGVARGTFYRYFRDKADLVRVLAAQAGSELSQVADELAGFGPELGSPAGLKPWVHRYIAVRRRHAGAIRIWAEGGVGDDAVDAVGRDLVLRSSAAMHAALTHRLRHAPISQVGPALSTIALVLVVMLEQAPLAYVSRREVIEQDLDSLVSDAISRVVRALVPTESG